MRRCALLLLLAWLFGCAPTHPKTSDDVLVAARTAARTSQRADVVGQWLLAELLAPGGDVQRAAQARGRLAALGDHSGDMAGLAQALDDDAHGRFSTAADGYLQALMALRDRSDPAASILGWLVANRLNALRGATSGLWERAAERVIDVIDHPGGIGWRARGELVEWWGARTLAAAGDRPTREVLEEVAARHGCLREARIAGPFGRGALSDARTHFAPEAPAPWPARFAPHPDQYPVAPRQGPVRHHGCRLMLPGRTPGGVYYVQSFIELTAPQELIIAVQGAQALFVDDTEVLTRRMSDWGTHARFGVTLRLAAGRHRIVARTLSDETSIRVHKIDGRPLGVVGSADQSRPYYLGKPTVLADPNALSPYLDAAGVARIPGAQRVKLELDNPAVRYAAAYLAHLEGQDDLASVLFEPLVSDLEAATPLALAQQAVFVDRDPLYATTDARDLARDFRERAAKGDPGLWGPQVWLVLQKADTQEASEVVQQMEALVERFPEVPLVITRLAIIYARLGWTVEQKQTLLRASERFGEDLDILKALLRIHEQQGEHAAADAVATRIRQVDPGDEVDFLRALERRDFEAAISELRRIGELHKDREDIALRIANLLARAGKAEESISKLEQALAENPGDDDARLALADARYAAGDRHALSEALADAILGGHDDRRLRAVIELVEGMTNLEPHRRDGLEAIRRHQEGGTELPGDAARVLDYAALWVAADGSARMLEHEIIHVQSREGIAKLVEQSLPRGIVLRLRTVKKDGRILEPELIAGKPTVTMPHLEVGDYIETESIWLIPSATGGKSFLSPRWYFREENVSYHLSEFVVITPRTRELVVETTGTVPEPSVEQVGPFTLRRWVVEGSIALPEEPLSVPIQEFLPSVRLGWGISPDERLRHLANANADEEPYDPRMRRIANTIARGAVAKDASGKGASGKAAKGDPGEAGSDQSKDARARRIYRWVLENVRPGEEQDPARVVTSKSGDRTRAFLHLCRLAGITADLAVVRDRLTPDPVGPISGATVYSTPAVRVATESGHRWVVLIDRFAPYGYLPSSRRGQPAVIIGERLPAGDAELEHAVTSSAEGDDGILHDASVELRADGSAAMKLTQEYRGKYAVIARTGLSAIGDARRREVIEARILGAALPGARLTDLTVEQMDELDRSVKLVMTIEIPAFARLAQGELRIHAPFLPRLEPLARLPERQTPLYLPERIATRTTVRMRVSLPAGASVITELEARAIDDGPRTVKVGDRLDGKVLVIERTVELPAGRVPPSEYEAFRGFALRGDEALSRELRIAVP